MTTKPWIGVTATRKFLLPVLGAMLLLAGCNAKNEYVAPPPPTVTVSRPLQQSVTDYAEFTGTTEAVESVEIRAQVEGYLERILFTPSAEVKKGDLLFVIDSKPYQAKLDEARAELLIRKAELKLAGATLKRRENAFKDRAVSEVEVIEATAQRDQAQAAIEAARAAIQTALLNLSYTEIRSPISGRIGRSLVDVGNLVGAGERTLLANIVKDDPIYAYFSVSERDLLYHQRHHRRDQSPTNGNGHSQVYLGLSDQPGYPREGRLDYIDNRVDAATGTIMVRGIFPNPEHQLLPGLFARIRVPIGNQDNALLVPDHATGADQQGRFVLVVNGENTVEYRPVKIGALIEGQRVIVDGLAPDDRVIVNGIQRARPGITVTPKEAQSQASAPTDTPQPSKEGA